MAQLINLYMFFLSSSHQEAVTVLMRLCILQSVPLISGQPGASVNKAFQKNLTETLCGGLVMSPNNYHCFVEFF